MPEMVAVQILPDRVQLARAQQAGDTVRLVELVSQPLQGTDGLEEAMALVRQRGVENVGLALLVNWQDYSLRDLWMPFTNVSQIRSTLKFELEDDLDAAAADLLVPSQVIEQRPDASHVLAWPISRRRMHELLDPWEQRGFSPEYMPPDIIGHVGLLQTQATDLAEKPVVTVTGDDKTVDVAMIHKGVLWARRRMVSFAWATEAAGRPLQEFRRMVLAVPGFPPPEAIVSFGGEAADTLAAAAAQDIGCLHRRIAPPAVEGAGHLLSWPLVAGAALLMARGGPRPLTFRIEEFEPRETAQAISLLSVWAVALLGICFLVGGVFCLIRASDYHRRLAEVYQAADTFWTTHRAEGRRPDDMAYFAPQLKQQIDKLQTQIEQAKANVDVTDLLAQFAQQATKTPEGIDVEYQRMTVNASAISLRGKANTYEAATQLRALLDESPLFDCETRKVQADPRDNNRAEFDFLITPAEKK
ncbi:MAG TPA: hypothetical protein PLP01_00585 [Phycisphaerae bacterium]|nr:hypothetical protein [Phycisphaerae bacterium]